jgi:ribosomal protein S18 acetylase RimI-like enzyme
MTAVRIERMGPDEGCRWRDIRLEALREAPYAFGTKYTDAALWTSARWEAQVTQFATFVAVVEGRDVGVARGAAHRSSDVRELISMWVAPTARRRQIGSRLIDSVAAWATADGATALVLEVVATNAAALAMYERADFLRLEDEVMGASDPREIRLIRSLATYPARRDWDEPSSGRSRSTAPARSDSPDR